MTSRSDPPPPFASSEAEPRQDAEQEAARRRAVPRQRWDHVRNLLTPWSGMLGAGFGWALAHQLGSDLAQDQCGAANPVVMILIGLLGIAIIGFGGLVSWRAIGREEGGRKFVAFVGALMAALFAVALIMQTSATFLLPRCFG